LALGELHPVATLSSLSPTIGLLLVTSCTSTCASILPSGVLPSGVLTGILTGSILTGVLTISVLPGGVLTISILTIRVLTSILTSILTGGILTSVLTGGILARILTRGVLISILSTSVLIRSILSTRAPTSNSEFIAVILSTTLSNLDRPISKQNQVQEQFKAHRHDYRLMIRCCYHSADTIGSSWKTTSHSGTEASIAITGIIDTLEKCEGDRIRWGFGVDISLQILDCNVSVAYNFAALKLLGSRIIGSIRIGESASHKIVNLYGDIKILVCFDVLTWSWKCDN
jgi:hypothetical protein